MAGRRRAAGTDAPSPDDRGVLRVLAALVHLVVVLVLLAALIAGAVLFGPVLVEEFEEGTSPVVFEEPPPAGDREPNQTDSNDPGESTFEASSGTFTAHDVEDFVHAAVNDRRAEHGADPIEWDGTVASVSRAHSADMNDREYFDHTNLEGEDPMDRFRANADYCRAYGENLAMTWADRNVQSDNGEEVDRYETPEELADGLVEQWMNSPPHREAMLEESWDRGGVGVYLSDDGQVFATHNFCEVP